MKNKYEANSKVFKAFCDENRLMILEILQSGEKCACHLLEKNKYQSIHFITSYENIM